MRSFITAVAAGAALVVNASACAQETMAPRGCDANNAGLELPAGFCAGIFAKGLAGARHMAVAPNGDVYVTQSAGRGGSGDRGIVRLRDANGDGKADSVQLVAQTTGSGIWIANNHIYAEAGGRAIVRYVLTNSGKLGAPDTIVSGLPTGGHSTRDMVVRGNSVYVNIGSRTNSCQKADRQNNSPGVDPCVELETRAGTWEFDANKTGQVFSPAKRFATGIRNGVSLTLNPIDNELYVVQHGRDQLAQNWGRPNEESAENPGEELFHVTKGGDYGWPYCYYSHAEKKKVTAPEYGGDGKKDDRCTSKVAPLYAFPGHWAPNASHFYTGTQFPAEYRGGIFVAFHGSWNRAPLPQQGFNVAFLPMKDGKATGPHRVFAKGFQSAGQRPTGLAQLPDGSLLVSDDGGGNIFRISYTGR
jgi:glucose/arabinose dehydrogenase